MKTEWMGRYRSFVAAIVKHSNLYSKVSNRKTIEYKDFHLTHVEWQILEYLLENPENDGNMKAVSEALGIAASSFSKYVANLAKYGLVEKYMAEGNQKNIIVRISEDGCRCYDQIVTTQMRAVFEDTFRILDALSDQELMIVENAIKALKYIDTEQKEYKIKKKLIKVH